MARNQDFLKAWPNDNLKHIQIQPWDNSKATFWRNNVINSLLVQVVFVKCHGKGNRYPQLHSQLPWYCCQLKIKAHPQQHMSITPARRNISRHNGNYRNQWQCIERMTYWKLPWQVALEYEVLLSFLELSQTSTPPSRIRYMQWV